MADAKKISNKTFNLDKYLKLSYSNSYLDSQAFLFEYTWDDFVVPLKDDPTTQDSDKHNTDMKQWFNEATPPALTTQSVDHFIKYRIPFYNDAVKAIVKLYGTYAQLRLFSKSNVMKGSQTLFADVTEYDSFVASQDYKPFANFNILIEGSADPDPTHKGDVLKVIDAMPNKVGPTLNNLNTNQASDHSIFQALNKYQSVVDLKLLLFGSNTLTNQQFLTFAATNPDRTPDAPDNTIDPKHYQLNMASLITTINNAIDQIAYDDKYAIWKDLIKDKDSTNLMVMLKDTINKAFDNMNSQMPVKLLKSKLLGIIFNSQKTILTFKLNPWYPKTIPFQPASYSYTSVKIVNDASYCYNMLRVSLVANMIWRPHYGTFLDIETKKFLAYYSHYEHNKTFSVYIYADTQTSISSAVKHGLTNFNLSGLNIFYNDTGYKYPFYVTSNHSTKLYLYYVLQQDDNIHNYINGNQYRGIFPNVTGTHSVQSKPMIFTYTNQQGQEVPVDSYITVRKQSLLSSAIAEHVVKIIAPYSANKALYFAFYYNFDKFLKDLLDSYEHRQLALHDAFNEPELALLKRNFNNIHLYIKGFLASFDYHPNNIINNTYSFLNGYQYTPNRDVIGYTGKVSDNLYFDYRDTPYDFAQHQKVFMLKQALAIWQSNYNEDYFFNDPLVGQQYQDLFTSLFYNNSDIITLLNTGLDNGTIIKIAQQLELVTDGIDSVTLTTNITIKINNIKTQMNDIHKKNAGLYQAMITEFEQEITIIREQSLTSANQDLFIDNSLNAHIFLYKAPNYVVSGSQIEPNSFNIINIKLFLNVDIRLDDSNQFTQVPRQDISSYKNFIQNITNGKATIPDARLDLSDTIYFFTINKPYNEMDFIAGAQRVYYVTNFDFDPTSNMMDENTGFISDQDTIDENSKTDINFEDSILLVANVDNAKLFFRDMPIDYNENITSIAMVVEKSILLNKVEASGFISERQQNIDLFTIANKDISDVLCPWRFTPIQIDTNNVIMYSPWFDPHYVLPMFVFQDAIAWEKTLKTYNNATNEEHLKVNVSYNLLLNSYNKGQTADDFKKFAQIGVLPQHEIQLNTIHNPLSDLPQDLIVKNEFFKDSFKPLVIDLKSGKFLSNQKIGSLQDQIDTFTNKDARDLIDNSTDIWFSRMNFKGGPYHDTSHHLLKPFIASLGSRISSQYAIDGGDNKFHNVYLPYYFDVEGKLQIAADFKDSKILPVLPLDNATIDDNSLTALKKKTLFWKLGIRDQDVVKNWYPNLIPKSHYLEFTTEGFVPKARTNLSKPLTIIDESYFVMNQLPMQITKVQKAYLPVDISKHNAEALNYHFYIPMDSKLDFEAIMGSKRFIDTKFIFYTPPPLPKTKDVSTMDHQTIEKYIIDAFINHHPNLDLEFNDLEINKDTNKATKDNVANQKLLNEVNGQGKMDKDGRLLYGGINIERIYSVDVQQIDQTLTTYYPLSYPNYVVSGIFYPVAQIVFAGQKMAIIVSGFKGLSAVRQALKGSAAKAAKALQAKITTKIIGKIVGGVVGKVIPKVFTVLGGVASIGIGALIEYFIDRKTSELNQHFIQSIGIHDQSIADYYQEQQANPQNKLFKKHPAHLRYLNWLVSDAITEQGSVRSWAWLTRFLVFAPLINTIASAVSDIDHDLIPMDGLYYHQEFRINDEICKYYVAQLLNLKTINNIHIHSNRSSFRLVIPETQFTSTSITPTFSFTYSISKMQFTNVLIHLKDTERVLKQNIKFQILQDMSKRNAIFSKKGWSDFIRSKTIHPTTTLKLQPHHQDALNKEVIDRLDNIYMYAMWGNAILLKLHKASQDDKDVQKFIIPLVNRDNETITQQIIRLM